MDKETINKTLAKFLWDTDEPVHMAFSRSLDMCRMVERKLASVDYDAFEDALNKAFSWDPWLCYEPEVVARALAETIIEAGLVEVE